MKTKLISAVLLGLFASAAFCASENLSADFSRSVSLQTLVNQATQLSPEFSSQCAVIWNGTGGTTAVPGGYVSGYEGKAVVRILRSPLGDSGVVTVPAEKMVVIPDSGLGSIPAPAAGIIPLQHMGTWIGVDLINRSIVLNGAAGWLPLKRYSRIARACIDTQIELANSLLNANLTAFSSPDQLLRSLSEKAGPLLQTKIERSGATEVLFHGKGEVSYRYSDGSVLTAKEAPAMNVSLQSNGVVTYDDKLIAGRAYSVAFKRSGGATIMR
ncbi:MAG: hypothetical protein ABIK25_07185 [Pseudomonadota bacterium]